MAFKIINGRRFNVPDTKAEPKKTTPKEVEPKTTTKTSSSSLSSTKSNDKSYGSNRPDATDKLGDTRIVAGTKQVFDGSKFVNVGQATQEEVSNDYASVFSDYKASNPSASVYDFQAVYGTQDEFESNKAGIPPPVLPPVLPTAIPTDFSSIVDALADVIKDLIPKDQDIRNLSDEELADVMREAEATVGPEFTRLRERTEQDFDIAFKTSQEELQKTFSQTAEDLPEAKKRQARNFQEAMADTQMALQNRQLTYSGIRKEEEGKLETSNRETLADLQKNVNRGLADTQKQFEKLYGSGNIPQLAGVEGYKPTAGNEIGTEQIKQTRSLEDLMRGQKQETEIEYQRRKGERSLSNLI